MHERTKTRGKRPLALRPGRGTRRVREATTALPEVMTPNLRALLLAVESSPVSVLITDAAGNIEYVNPRLCELTGYSASELIGQNPRMLNAGLLIPEFYQDLWETISQGQTWTGDLLNRTRNGDLFWESARIIPVTNESGRITHYLGVKENITRLRSTEKTLHETEQRLISHVENSPLAAIEWDVDGRVTRWSSQAEMMFGWKAFEVVGRTIEQVGFVYEEDRLATGQTIATLLAGQSRMISRNRNVTRDGRVIHCEWYSSVLYDTEGKLLSVLSLAQDISERVASDHAREAALDALRRSEERQRSILESANAIIFTLSLDGRFLYLSPTWTDYLGYTVEEAIGRNFREYIHEDAFQEIDDYIAAILNGTDADAVEFRVRHRDGTWRWHRATGSVHRDSAGTPLQLVGVAIDSTERRLMETKLIQAEKLASMGKLVAGVAHEINNPLAAISAAAQIFLMHSDEDVRQDAEAIHRMCDRATRIVRSLLCFARQQPGKHVPLDINGIVADAYEMVRYQLNKKGVALIQECSPDLPRINAHEGEILQVLVNLIGNAILAVADIPENERRIIVRSYVGSDADGRTCVGVSVADNGCGIDESQLNNIFDPFYTTRATGEGTGLGLSISYGIAQAHGGTLSVRSRIGEGSEFTLLLPALAPAERKTNP